MIVNLLENAVYVLFAVKVNFADITVNTVGHIIVMITVKGMFRFDVIGVIQHHMFAIPVIRKNCAIKKSISIRHNTQMLR